MGHPLCGLTTFCKLDSTSEVLRCLFVLCVVMPKEIMGFLSQTQRSSQYTNNFNTFADLDQLCDGAFQVHVYRTSDIRHQKWGFFEKKGGGGCLCTYNKVKTLVWYKKQAN